MKAVACLMLALLAAPCGAQAGPDHFERHHPDVYHRQRGLEAFGADRPHAAVAEFLQGARFADKGSQAMLAEMHWDGLGVPPDRAVAYAWMDLAAERGYPLLVAKRERYSQAMTPAERERALVLGVALYADYGDAVAKPRLDDILLQGTRDIVGSRVGGTAAFVEVYTDIGRGDSKNPVQGRKRPDYYAARYWQPDDYWRSVDLAWSTPPKGIVRVLPIERD